MRREKATHTIDIIFALSLFCAFSASVLLVLMTGVKVYRDSVDSVESGFEQRTCISYVVEKIRHFNTRGAVKLGEFGDTSAVFLSEDIENTLYYTVIYVNKGMLMELFYEEGMNFNPEDGEKIIPAGNIDFKWEDENLLYIEYTGIGGTFSNTYMNVLSSKETEGEQ